MGVEVGFLAGWTAVGFFFVGCEAGGDFLMGGTLDFLVVVVLVVVVVRGTDFLVPMGWETMMPVARGEFVFYDVSLPVGSGSYGVGKLDVKDGLLSPVRGLF